MRSERPSMQLGLPVSTARGARGLLSCAVVCRLVAGSMLASPILASSVLLACSGNDTSRIESALEPESSTGQLELSLTARGASGSLYRLRRADFQVFKQDFSFFTFLSSENDPQATTLEATLDTGDYQIDLFTGWFLEKVIDGVNTPVSAQLISPSTQFFNIQTNEETFVSFRFETNGEIVEFGQGRLVVQLEVEETTGGGTQPGDPLEITGGLIFPESNVHGIGAALFTITSPENAAITVTSDTGSICVEGAVGVVQNADFANQWGAFVGLDLMAFTGLPWDLDGGNVTGFSFVLSGLLPPLRLAAQPGNSDPNVDFFCRVLDTSSMLSSFEVPFDSLDRECWLGVRDPMLADSLSNINWTIPADEFTAHEFSFCINELRPLLRGSPGEMPPPPVGMPEPGPGPMIDARGPGPRPPPR